MRLETILAIVLLPFGLNYFLSSVEAWEGLQ
jgi:hypothetical protein